MFDDREDRPGRRNLADDDLIDNIWKGKNDRRNPHNDQLYNGPDRRRRKEDRRSPYNAEYYSGPERRRLRANYTHEEYTRLRNDSAVYEETNTGGGPVSGNAAQNSRIYTAFERGHEQEDSRDYGPARDESVKYENSHAGAPVRAMGKVEAALSEIILKNAVTGLDYGAGVINEVGTRRVDVDHSAVSVSLGQSHRPVTDPLAEVGEDLPAVVAGNAYSFDLYNRLGGKADVNNQRMNERKQKRDIDFSI